MAFNYSFRFCEDEKDILKVLKFLETQPFDYPNYFDWVCRAKEELLTGYKKAILGFSDGVLIMDLIFQPHKDFPGNFLELKNLRVHEKLRGRYFGVFGLKQAEAEAKEKYQGIICDTHSNNFPVISLLKFMGYQELLRAPIYDENSEEIIFGKTFGKDKEIFVPIEKKILERVV